MERLVFDIGMHCGDDTAFYLARGFKVIALEANPLLCADVSSRFHTEIQDGRLVIVQKALWEKAGEELTFHMSRANSTWSSLDSWRAEKGGSDGSDPTPVSTTTLDELLKEYGIPHYIKCDIEGADHHLCDQLLLSSTKPDFISVEGTSIELMAQLLSSGYDKFQLVNQSKIKRFPGSRKLSAVYGEMEYQFSGHSSGPFGFDLDADRWITFKDAAFQWLKFSELKKLDPDLALDSWFDFHATTKKTLKRQRLASD